jgi:hypothetical protein
MFQHGFTEGAGLGLVAAGHPFLGNLSLERLDPGVHRQGAAK